MGHSVALFLSLFPVALAAQTRDSTRLAELVVTATRSPQPLRALGSSVSVVGRDELARRQMTQLKDALQLAPGSLVLSNGAPGAVTSVFLRGVSSSQTLFLVDGIRVNDANTPVGSFLGGADLGGLNRLEIVRGPQSTLYGGAAIGGVISLDAARGTGPGQGMAEVEGGSFESWRGRLQAGARRGRLGMSTALTANGTANQRRPNDWDQRTQLVRLDFEISDRVSLGTTFRGLQNDYTSPGDLRSSNTTPVGTTTFENNLVTAWLEAVPTSRWRTRMTLGGQEQFTKGSERFNGSDPFVSTLSNSRRVLDWQNSFRLGGSSQLVTGINREWSTARSDGTAEDERMLGVYAEGWLTPVPQVTVTAGVRRDHYNTFDNALTGRVTAAWFPMGSSLKVRASYGTGFMPPSLSDRFGSAFQNANPEIRPERSRGWDAGIDQELADGKAAIGITWFRNLLRDLIGFEGATFPALGRSVNVDRARTQGLEISGRLQTGRVDARAAWTVMSAVSQSETDPALVRLIRRPRYALAADVVVSVAQQTELGAGLQAVADREDADFNQFPAVRVNPGDYALVRIYGSQGVGRRLSLRLRVENLLNARYEPVYGFPGLGRSVTGTAAVTF